MLDNWLWTRLWSNDCRKKVSTFKSHVTRSMITGTQSLSIVELAVSFWSISNFLTYTPILPPAMCPAEERAIRVCYNTIFVFKREKCVVSYRKLVAIVARLTEQQFASLDLVLVDPTFFRHARYCGVSEKRDSSTCSFGYRALFVGRLILEFHFGFESSAQKHFEHTHETVKRSRDNATNGNELRRASLAVALDDCRLMLRRRLLVTRKLRRRTQCHYFVTSCRPLHSVCNSADYVHIKYCNMRVGNANGILTEFERCVIPRVYATLRNGDNHFTLLLLVCLRNVCDNVNVGSD